MKNLNRTFPIFGVLAIIFMVLGAPSLARAKTLSYTVLRDGKPIGAHSYDINANGNETTVKVSTDIAVKILFATVYQFVHSSTEQWDGDKLISIKSTTNDDGVPKKLDAMKKGTVIAVNSIVKKDDRASKAPQNAIPASLWNPLTISQNKLLNTLDGSMMKVSVEDLGEETVPANGGTVKAHRYKITGELTRELWFDDSGVLVRVRFPAKDNSEIVYALN